MWPSNFCLLIEYNPCYLHTSNYFSDFGKRRLFLLDPTQLISYGVLDTYYHEKRSFARRYFIFHRCYGSVQDEESSKLVEKEVQKMCRLPESNESSSHYEWDALPLSQVGKLNPHSAQLIIYSLGWKAP